MQSILNIINLNYILSMQSKKYQFGENRLFSMLFVIITVFLLLMLIHIIFIRFVNIKYMNKYVITDDNSYDVYHSYKDKYVITMFIIALFLIFILILVPISKYILFNLYY